MPKTILWMFLTFGFIRANSADNNDESFDYEILEANESRRDDSSVGMKWTVDAPSPARSGDVKNDVVMRAQRVDVNEELEKKTHNEQRNIKNGPRRELKSFLNESKEESGNGDIDGDGDADGRVRGNATGIVDADDDSEARDLNGTEIKPTKTFSGNATTENSAKTAITTAIRTATTTKTTITKSATPRSNNSSSIEIIVLKENNSFEFHCEVRPFEGAAATPRTTVYRQGKEIGSNYKFVGINVSLVNVSNQLGQYECKRDGLLLRTIQVISKPLVLFINYTTNEASNTLTTNELRLEVGTTNVVLVCQVFSYPLIRSFKWIRPDGEEMVGTTPAKAGSTNHSISLQLGKVTIEHEGNYTCEATNEVGTTREDVTLHVLNPWNAVWPLLGIVIVDVVLTTLIFLCEKWHNRKVKKRHQRKMAEKVAEQKKPRDKERVNRNSNNNDDDDDDSNDDINDDDVDSNDNNGDGNNDNDIHIRDGDNNNDDASNNGDGVDANPVGTVPRGSRLAVAAPRHVDGAIDAARSRDAVVAHVNVLTRIRSSQSECLPNWKFRDEFAI